MKKKEKYKQKLLTFKNSEEIVVVLSKTCNLQFDGVCTWENYSRLPQRRVYLGMALVSNNYFLGKSFIKISLLFASFIHDIRPVLF